MAAKIDPPTLEKRTSTETPHGAFIRPRLGPLIATHLPFVLLAAGLALFALWGAGQVPFHPDEATQLFMSADLDLLFRDPLSMAWDPARESALRQRYRELDAPLTRYLLGLGRLAAGLPAPPVDWDWSRDWDANQAAGAVPGQNLLLAGRLAVTLLLPLTFYFLYGTGRELGGRLAGLLAVLFLGLNALTLLHARRAMAEGALLFGVSFALWSFLRAGRYPWLAGLAVALAFCAKQSALALLPVGLLAVLWVDPPQTVRRRLVNAALYLGVFLLVVLALNPLYWRSPLGAARAALAARQDLSQRQAADALHLAPGKVLDTPGERLLGLTAHLYFAPPAFAELSNYLEATAPAEASYLASDLHILGRGFVAGGISFALSLFGLAWILINLRRVDPLKRRRQVLLLLAAGGQTAAVLAFLFLPWQRYVMPVLPFACLLAACGVAGLFSPRSSPGFLPGE